VLYVDLSTIRCVVFDFGFTLSSDLYFTVVPPEYPNWRAIIQQLIFDQPAVVRAWMTGERSLVDMARIVASEVDLPIPVIVETMERGCTKMSFNEAVWEFACAQRAQGRKTALVTANMDVFSKVVVPAHRLDTVFDVILNTADYGVLSKDILWDHAFTAMGDGIGYTNSLLIEDGPKEPAMFRARGGRAYQYEDDQQFRAWLHMINWRP
jgi:phosphoserine phosphatase